MAPIDIVIARAYLKADGDDDDLISPMIESATTMCEDYCNRKFYPDADTFAADFITALADRSLALANRAAALATITGTDMNSLETWALIMDRYSSVLTAIKQRINGKVIDPAINAAILITLGHLYVNREDNLSTGNNVVQVPVGAQRILQSKLWIGDLADGVPASQQQQQQQQQQHSDCGWWEGS